MTENNKIDVIPYDTLVSVEVSGAYYARVQQLLMYIFKDKAADEVSKCMEELKSREPKDIFEYQVITILSLMYEIEVKAREQKKTVVKDLDELKESLKSSEVKPD
jgi:hypothetical protein